MYYRIRKRLEEREEGFTLIELLVVVIIIGILAAIAIPVFLAQRNKAHDAGAKADLRNVATAEEAYLTDNPSGYTSTLSLLTGSSKYGFNQTTGIDMALGAAGSSGYCAVAYSTDSKNYWFYDSEAGGLMPASSTTNTWPSGNPAAVACSTLPTNFSPALP